MRLIDADAFIEENKGIIDCEIDHPKYQDTLRELINNAPTVERPHGEWIPVDIEEWVFRCSLCHDISTFESKFCGNCGARMKGGESE